MTETGRKSKVVSSALRHSASRVEMLYGKSRWAEPCQPDTLQQTLAEHNHGLSFWKQSKWRRIRIKNVAP